MPDRPTAGSVETRTAPQTIAPTVDDRRLHGVVPYNVESRDLGGWREVIDAGALDGANLDDLIANVDHAGVPLGRHPGTLTIEDRADGLHWSVDLPASRSDVRDAVQRGDLRSTSWRMVVARDRWDGDVRHVQAISELRDVSVVTAPAYPAAVAEYRSTPTPSTEEPAMPTPVTPPTPEVDEDPAPTARAGTLRVEDRTASVEARSVEDRFDDVIRTVNRGEARSLTTTTANDLTPADVSTMLVDRLARTSVALSSGIKVISTDRTTVSWPQVISDPTPAFYNELDVIAPSDPVFATLTADPKKIAVRTEFSNEVLDDSVPDAATVVRNLMLRALSEKLDVTVFEGDAIADPKAFNGLKNTAGIQTVSMGTNGATITSLTPIADAVEMLELVNATAGAIVMHPRTWADLRLLRDDSGAAAGTGGYFIDPLGNVSARPTLFGTPVYLTTALSITETQGTASNASSIYVYATGEAGPILVRRQDVTIELDRSRLFDKDASEMRGKMRADLLVPQPSAVVRVVGVKP